MEATGGFEPPNTGFADPRLKPLGHVAPHVNLNWCRGGDSNSYSLCGHSALNAACLPIPPPRQDYYLSLRTVVENYIEASFTCL